MRAARCPGNKPGKISDVAVLILPESPSAVKRPFWAIGGALPEIVRALRRVRPERRSYAQKDLRNDRGPSRPQREGEALGIDHGQDLCRLRRAAHGLPQLPQRTRVPVV